MSFAEGTAADEYDLMSKLTQFIVGGPSLGTPNFTGTGNGTLDDLESFGPGPTETWTINCTTVKSADTAVGVTVTNGTFETGDLTGWTIVSGGWEILTSPVKTAIIETASSGSEVAIAISRNPIINSLTLYIFAIFAEDLTVMLLDFATIASPATSINILMNN